MSKNKAEKPSLWSRPSLKIGVISGIIVLVIFGIFWWGIDHWIEDPTLRGVFGDKFGAINALFSGFAFLGLIITLVFQQEELKLQRTELEQTRDELVNQRKEYEVQNRTLRYQQFDSTLYSMMSLQQQIVSDLYFDSSILRYSRPGPNNTQTIIVKGRDLFRFSFLQQRIHYTQEGVLQTASGFKQCLNTLGLGYYLTSSAPFIYDHYFRHLYRIIKFIDSCTILSPEEKYQVVGNVRGTLSRYELVWLYYNILANRYLKFKELVEKYAFFKNLDPSALALCAENVKPIDNYGLENLEAKGFYSTDFFFFMTDRKNDDGRYYIGAFFNEKDSVEIGVGLFKLNEWRSLNILSNP